MISVAIDGPAGAGKSSLSRKASEKLGFIYVDTGAMYRAVGLKFSNSNIDISDDNAIKKTLNETTVDIKFVNKEQRVFLDSIDVSDDIRTPEASIMASKVSAKPSVRAFLLGMQRKLAESNNVLMDGRDIGTVVLPNATVKIYLTASSEARAERRFKELIEKGTDVKYEDVYNDIIERDFNDMNRKIAPLKKADDAVMADTTSCTFEESLDLILKIIGDKIGQKN